jgi:hypothetical protein
MSIADIPGKGKLVVPDISECDTQQEMAWLYEECGLPVHPWIRTRTKISARRGKGFFNSPEVIETYEDIALWARRWQVGFACSWRTGLITIDVDDPAEFDDWELSHYVPDTVRVATGREGGYHLYLDCRHLRSAVPVESWPRQGDIPGGTLKTNGFVGAPGSRHPSGQLYRVTSVRREVARGSLELARLLAEYRAQRAPSALETTPGYLGDLWRRTLAAREGEQHEAVLMLLNALEREMSREAITGLVFPFLVKALPAYNPRDPWTLDGLLELLGSTQTTVTTAEEERLLRDIAHMTPHIAGEEGEDWFWNSREELTTIRQWAQAQRVGPWALLGEIIAEVVARVPPNYALPDIVVGPGTLNMLLAITGDSGAGKGGAAAVARMALDIDEPKASADGREINPFMKPERIPVGSGEGLVKNFAFRAGGIQQLVTHTSIITAYEIDTLSAMVGRNSETLTSQLRHLFSGEQLGFGYSNPASRVLIKPFTYRGVFVAGVQPERSGVIVNDTGSGFAQRWIFLDANDPWIPDVKPPKPEQIKWSLPDGIEVDEDACARGEPTEYFIVCQEAIDEIQEARDKGLAGNGDKSDSHRLYAQEKFAIDLALLARRTEMTPEDWRLSAYAMERSDGLRERCRAALRKQKRSAARAEGQLEGIKDVAKEDMRGKESDRKLQQLVLKHIPADGRISYGKLANKFSPERRPELREVLAQMVKAKLIIAEEGEYNGQPAMRYSRAERR